MGCVQMKNDHYICFQIKLCIIQNKTDYLQYGCSMTCHAMKRFLSGCRQRDTSHFLHFHGVVFRTPLFLQHSQTLRPVVAFILGQAAETAAAAMSTGMWPVGAWAEGGDKAAFHRARQSAPPQTLWALCAAPDRVPWAGCSCWWWQCPKTYLKNGSVPASRLVVYRVILDELVWQINPTHVLVVLCNRCGTGDLCRPRGVLLLHPPIYRLTGVRWVNRGAGRRFLCVHPLHIHNGPVADPSSLLQSSLWGRSHRYEGIPFCTPCTSHTQPFYRHGEPSRAWGWNKNCPCIYGSPCRGNITASWDKPWPEGMLLFPV